MLNAPSQAIDNEIGPAALRNYERAAVRQQRTAGRLQAGYLLVLLAAPLARLVPLPGREQAGFDDAASALLLLAAVGMRLAMRRIAAEADWVRARRESEQIRAGAWRRCMTGRAGADDGPAGRSISGTDVGTRWQFYRQHRIADQISYFSERASQHRKTARRWRAIRMVLTIGTFLVAVSSLLVPVPTAVIGLVSALLASSEAWLQFRRSEILAASFAEARDDLVRLQVRQPADEQSLRRAIQAVERALERERWTWTAIMSVSVLASSSSPSGRSGRSGRSGAGVPK